MMRRRSAFALALTAAAVSASVLPSVCVLAQDDAPSPPPNLYTLHVYTNLMQFPTVVLGSDLKPIPPVPREKFNITIDGGPVFHPTKMRIEGDDPISLAVLLDVGGDQSSVLRAFTQSFARLIPGSLHPQDRVSIYAVDCKLMRTMKDQPAVDPSAIEQGVANALVVPGLHGNKTKPACGYNLHLWDTMVMVAQDMGDPPSRRVLLVVSLGREKGSKNNLTTAADYLSSKGVAVFGLRDNTAYEREEYVQQFSAPVGRGRGLILAGGVNPDDLFGIMCGRNGGMILDASNPGVAKDLEHLIDLLRGRYIIEYPRPDDRKAAMQSIEITVAGIDAFVRPTGDSSPITDPAIANDPNTLPSTPSPAKIGNHRRRVPQS
jgi:hypothetical protein